MDAVKKVLIIVAVVLVGAAVVAANLWYAARYVSRRHRRGDQGSRPRGHRVGVRQDSAEAPGQHQRRHPRPGRRARGQRGRPRDPRAVPAADRSEVAADPRRQRHRVARRRQTRRSSRCRQSVETARVQVEQARADLARQRELWSQQLTTREALERAENERAGRRVVAAGAREAGRRAGGAHRAGARRARERPLRSQQGPHRIADRRHRHAPQHPGGRNGGDRHHEQRRHRAPDARRHVGDPGRGRSRRDEHSPGLARTARPRSSSTRCRTRPSSAGSPRSATARFRRPGPPDRGRPPTSRWWSSSKATFPTCARASPARPTSPPRPARASVAVPIPAVAVRELVYDDAPARSSATTGQIAAGAARRRIGDRSGRVGGRAASRADAQGNRGRVRHPRRPGRVRADQDGDRRRAVLRGHSPA